MSINYSGLLGGAGKAYMTYLNPLGSWMQKRTKDYMDKEQQNYLNAFLATMPQGREKAMMKAQIEAYKQSLADRRATRNLILGQMGYKVGKDSKGNDTLVPLTNEERLQIMTEAQKSRSSAAAAYDERAQAALKGQTKLPSFLKSNIDYQKEKENAVLSEIMGPGYENSTAAQQAVAEMKKKEEDIRQALQDQDIAVTPGMAQGIRGMLADEASQKIANYENLPKQQEGLMQMRGGLLQNMQADRLGVLKNALGQYERDRADKAGLINMFASIGGMSGGIGSGLMNRNKQPTADTGTANTTGLSYNYFGSSPYGGYSVSGVPARGDYFNTYGF